MPIFQVITEPMARVTLSWNEILWITEALTDALSQADVPLEEKKYKELYDFFTGVMDNMGEAA